MSEAITKACPVCEGTQRFKSFECPCCDKGRVPDVEATLRAEEARLTEENAYLKSECDEFHAQVKRMGAGMQEEHLAHQADVARLTAEVERLKGRDIAAAPLLRLVLDTTHMGDDWERDAEAWLAGCKS